MHAPYAAQYCVIGGSGAGSGGSFTPDAAAVCAALAAAVSEPPVSAIDADAGAVVAAGGVADVALAAGVVVAVVPVVALAGCVAAVAGCVVVGVGVAMFTPAPLAAGALAAEGMPVPGGVAEKLLGGKGGRDGVPVEVVLSAAGLRGGSCDSRAMLTLVCLLAAA
jgi:hypothetical protein